VYVEKHIKGGRGQRLLRPLSILPEPSPSPAPAFTIRSHPPISVTKMNLLHLHLPDIHPPIFGEFHRESADLDEILKDFARDLPDLEGGSPDFEYLDPEKPANNRKTPEPSCPDLLNHFLTQFLPILISRYLREHFAWAQVRGPRGIAQFFNQRFR